MGSQASRDTCEGDIGLWVTHLLSPICSGSPGTEVGECFQNRFYLTTCVQYDTPAYVPGQL